MSANYQQVELDLMQFFDAEYANETYIAYPNTEESIPEYEWIRYTDKPIQSTNETIGLNGVRVAGFIIIQVFTAIKTGVRRNSELCNIITNIFLNKVVGNIHIFTVNKVQVGDDGLGWYQQNLIINYIAQ